MPLFLRLLVVAFALGWLLDQLLPPRSETLTVARHSQAARPGNDHPPDRATELRLEFSGGSLPSATVGPDTWARVQDGDRVTARYSPLLKRTRELVHQDQVIHEQGGWRWLEVAAAVAMAAAALGLTRGRGG